MPGVADILLFASGLSWLFLSSYWVSNVMREPFRHLYACEAELSENDWNSISAWLFSSESATLDCDSMRSSIQANILKRAAYTILLSLETFLSPESSFSQLSNPFDFVRILNPNNQQQFMTGLQNILGRIPGLLKTLLVCWLVTWTAFVTISASYLLALQMLVMLSRTMLLDVRGKLIGVWIHFWMTTASQVLLSLGIVEPDDLRRD